MSHRSHTQCIATTGKGVRCRNGALPDSKYCSRHKPAHDDGADDAVREDPFDKLRDINRDEWAQVMEAHLAWVRSEGAEGARADLSGKRLQMVNLPPTSFAKALLQGTIFSHSSLRRCSFHDVQARGAYFTSCELQDSIFSGADLEGAWLNDAKLASASFHNANLRNANLSEAMLESEDKTEADLAEERAEQEEWGFSDPVPIEPRRPGADLTGANLSDANMRGARLADARGLVASSLAGADLSNARLPADISNFDGSLAYITAVTETAQKTFLTMIAACFYCWLSIGVTTDAALIVNSATTPLPIIQSQIPTVGFFLVAPAILMSLYLYLHLYLQRLWGALAALPARFVDGRAVDETANPWLLTSLVRRYIPRLREERPPLWHLQFWFSVVTAWTLVPLTIALFWMRYLPRHDWLGTSVLAVELLVAIGFGTATLMLMVRTLTKQVVARRDRLQGLLVCAAVAIPILALSVHATLAPRAISFGIYRNYLSLQQAEISHRPEPWSGDTTLVKGARLAGADLRYAKAAGAFLVGTDLTSADLRYADLRGADLRAAVFQDTLLQGANLAGADLRAAQRLTQRQIDMACGDPLTLLPAGLTLRPCVS